MAQKKKVRLSDIAEKLKISTVTVSKALSNKEGVGDELRDQIKQIAEKMGYQTKKTSSAASKNSVLYGIVSTLFFSFKYLDIFFTLYLEKSWKNKLILR